MTGILKGGVTLAAAVLLGLAATGANAAMTINPARPITEIVTIQPIIVSNLDGTNTAEFFGTLSQQSSIEGLIDNIWAQAGIDVDFLAPNSWDSSAANQGLDSLFLTLHNGAVAGVTNPNPKVINMYFVNVVPGFGVLSENTAGGQGVVNGNGIIQYIGSNLLGFLSGREVIAGVVAHELGHNLGLQHIVESQNLMQAGSASNPGQRLSAAQISTALASNFSVTAVPLPGAVWMLLSGVVSIAAVRRRAAARIS